MSASTTKKSPPVSLDDCLGIHREPALDLVGILFVKTVCDLAQRMTNDYAESFLAKISNAMAKMVAVHVKGVGEISLSTEDRVVHQSYAVTLRRCLHYIG